MESEDEFIETQPHLDDYDHEEEDEDGHKHKSLLEKISDLNVPDSVKRKRVRTEPREINELNLVKPDEAKLNLKQLIDKVKISTNNDMVSSIKKFSKKVNRKKVLNVPLEKIHKDRLERSVLFKEASKEVSKWEPVVLQNRVADQLTFPLKEPELKLEGTEQVAKKFKPRTDFEKEIHELLTSSENYLNDDQPLTEAEEKALRAMSIEEAKAKHRELRRQRALLSYQEAKLNRQNKIKSKSYHKLKKREKLKQTSKEFEELKKSDPKKALEKLQELEKIRIRERTTLKHLNTGKWAKFNKLRAKNDLDTKQKLAEQIDLNKQLIQKLFEESEEEEEANVSENDSETNFNADAYSILRADQNEGRSTNKETTTAENKEEEVDEQSQAMFASNYKNLIEKMNVEELEDMMHKKKKTKKKDMLKGKVTEIENDGVDSDEESKDSNDDESDVDEANYRKLISEALAEDDAVEDFSREKREIVDEEKGKDVDNFLPGWGSWAGEGVPIQKKRKKRFQKRAPEVIRKDRNQANVIISEKKDEVLNKYLPKTLPPGVRDVRLYQRKLSKPTGSNWNTETVFKNLIEPKLITKTGKIIAPMDADALMGVRKFTPIAKYNRVFCF